MALITPTITNGANDATFNADDQNWLFGEDYIYAGESDCMVQSLLMFTPQLPKELIVVSAKLKLYNWATVSEPADWLVGLMPVYSGSLADMVSGSLPSWVESAGGNMATVSPGWLEFNITPLVSRFCNDGHFGTDRLVLHVWSNAVPDLQFSSYEGNPTLSPRIEIQYWEIMTASSIAISRTSMSSLSLAGTKAIVL